MELVNNQLYSFTTKAPAILGARYERMKLVSISGYDLASTLRSVDDVHRAVYAYLGTGVPVSAKGLTYYVFKSETNDTLVLADIWIDTSTLTLVETINATIKLTIKSSLEVDLIRKALLALGYSDLSIVIE